MNDISNPYSIYEINPNMREETYTDITVIADIIIHNQIPAVITENNQQTTTRETADDIYMFSSGQHQTTKSSSSRELKKLSIGEAYHFHHQVLYPPTVLPFACHFSSLL